MKNFVHRPGTPELDLVELDPTTTVAEFARQQGAADALVFVDDGEEPLDASLTLEQVGVADQTHLHVARCRRVTATVHFNEESTTQEFPPNVGMVAVFQWAAGPKGFNLAPADKAEHMLVVTGTDTQVDEDGHLEGYASDECSAQFDLVPKHRFEG